MSDAWLTVICDCGQVLFAAGERKPGDTGTCPGCKKEFRYLGGSNVEMIDNSVVVVEGSEEIITHKIADPNITRIKVMSSKRKASRAAADANTPVRMKSPSDRMQQEAPGGIGLMIGFMVLFNALAFVILVYCFPKQEDGTRLGPWGIIVGRSTFPWAELVTLLAGQLSGYLAWAAYVYRFHHQSSNRPGSEKPEKNS